LHPRPTLLGVPIGAFFGLEAEVLGKDPAK
jgi:hypothetical protein